MKVKAFDPPRVFKVGVSKEIEIKDTAHIRLDADEQITLITEVGGEYDIVRKDWGYYATPSLNGRLSGFGLRGALVKGADGKFFLLLVEAGKEPQFHTYLAAQKMDVIVWLDDEGDLSRLEKAAKGKS